MNPPLKSPRDPWSRLVAAAREVDDERSTSAPYGFATRVAAIAFTQERKIGSLLEAFALRAMALAALLALGSVAWNYQAFVEPPPTMVAHTEEFYAAPPVDDAVAIVLDLAD
jgi:hypothetical protein